MSDAVYRDQFKRSLLYLVAPTRRQAEDTLLVNFGEIQRSVKRDTAITCVDISPVFEYYRASSGKELDALYRRTPIRLPFPAVIFGGVFPARDVSPDADEDATCVTLIECQRWASDSLLYCREVRFDAMKKTRGFYLQMNADGTLHENVDGRHPGVGKPKGVDLISPGMFVETVLCALAMFHVKNIGTRVQQLPRAIRRRLEKSGIDGPHVYRTLTLRPFAPDGEPNGRRMQTGERPLHLVRGHFARYTADRPLFGKYEGTFWRPEHEAGNPTVAVVRKTYKFDTRTTTVCSEATT